MKHYNAAIPLFTFKKKASNAIKEIWRFAQKAMVNLEPWYPKCADEGSHAHCPAKKRRRRWQGGALFPSNSHRGSSIGSPGIN
ncbi:hypothetical protein EV1_028611 [Malus domestica]